MLTDNFWLDEFLVSQTAARHGIDMTPPQSVIDNLKHLCVTVLQPLRNEVGESIRISSGYRPPELNSIINGSKTSAHRFGRAADFTVKGLTPFETVDLIVDMDLVYDQVIHEFGQWVHVGIAEIPRQEILTATRENGETRYLRGLV
jgi:zinc D-Ala-D-Ala carboxypeptidase